VNLVIADRLAPGLRMGPLTPEDEMVARYRAATERYTGRIRVGVAVFFALIAGLGVSSQWKEWMLFTHRVDFHRTDPQFHKDIGFYVFQLPFLRFIIDWLFAGLVIVLLVTAVAYYLNGGIRFQSATQRVSPHVKAHLSVILAAMALVKTAEYYYGRFELNFSTSGAVDGAGYTQVKAELPALNLLIFISIVAAALFLWNIWRRGWVLPIIAVGLWGFVSIVVGTIYPAMVQQFRVKPNEYAKERPYIARNIRATRDAYKLSRIDSQNFPFEPELTQQLARNNQTTIDNARLWDPDVIAATYGQVQEQQTYYNVDDVDIDRYTVNNGTVQTAISLREINGSALPTQSWINQHVVYTHGYGVIASPTNVSVDNLPAYFIKDIPVTTDQGISVDARGAQVYFGEQQGGYVIVDAKQPSFNYPRQGVRDSLSRYRGKDGVQLSSALRKAAFALRFSDINLLISGQIRPESKILLYRSIRSRVEKLAPFLRYDNDPYPVVVNNRVLWVIDAYTTSGKYPYSQYTEGINGLSGRFNYVRNSVKVTVDAYEGTVKFYVMPGNDPVIESWQKSFPDLFTKFRDMPNALKDHLRYPEDIFRVQAEQYAKYHVLGTRRFFQGWERWLISPDPNDAISAQATIAAPVASSRSAGGRSPEIKATSKRQDPYYLYIRAPFDDAESFLMLQSFVPVSQNNQQLRLVSFLTAKSDRRNYGEMQSFVMPQGQTVEGPVQAALQINQNPAISERFTLLNQEQSRLIKGTVQLIPVGNSIVYVQPIYIEGEGVSRLPLFQFVAVFTQGRDPVLAPTVNEALNLLFGSAPEVSSPESPGTVTPTPSTGSLADKLSQINQKLAEADAALRGGDLGRYQQLVNDVKTLTQEAQQLLNTSNAAASTSSSTTTTPRSGSGSGSASG